jgi:hypothetical protein
MSIYGSFFAIEDERQWVAELEAEGIKAGIIRDGDPGPDDLDAPVIYQGSHVLPEETDPRGGSLGLAHIAAHVRYYRENPDADGKDEPWEPPEPFLRLDVQEHSTSYRREPGSATVVLTEHQAERLRDALTGWLERLESHRIAEAMANARKLRRPR